jgi:cysteine desulfurase
LEGCPLAPPTDKLLPSYLDFNATTPVWPEVVVAMATTLGELGNPSSVHGFGRRSRGRLEAARAVLAQALGVAADRVVFTSGGTEANQLALGSVDGPVVVSAVEHPSVLDAVPDRRLAPVDGTGRVDLEALAKLLEIERPRLVSVMLANNETGIVQPVEEVARLAHDAGALVHVDAVQGLGKLPLALKDLGADMMTLSAHKIGGPSGVGALVLAPGVEPRARQVGGGQERRRRAGTENLSGIVGFAKAVETVSGVDWTRVAALREALEAKVLASAPEATVVGRDVRRLANTACIVLPGVRSETQIMALDLAGVAVSAGSACSSGKVAASHVLMAMGMPQELARCAIRVSLGWSTTAEDVERFIAAWRSLRDRAHGLPPRHMAPAVA